MAVVGNGDVSSRANARSREVDGAAIDVHRALGPGFLESVYEEALCMKLHERGIPFARQCEVAIHYKSRAVGIGRVDIIVDESLIIELKAVDALVPIHTAQLLSYLRITGYPLGLLINSNVATLKEGIRRIALSSALL
jgi:GxxExxY protein